MNDRINVTLLTFFKGPAGSPSELSLANVFDAISAEDRDGRPLLPPFQVLMHINVLGAGDSSQSYMERGEGRLLLILRLVKDSISESRRVGTDLGQYILDLSQLDAAICGTESHFINNMNLFQIPSLHLEPGYGTYHLKVSVGWLDENGKISADKMETAAAYEFAVQKK